MSKETSVIVTEELEVEAPSGFNIDEKVLSKIVLVDGSVQTATSKSLEIVDKVSTNFIDMLLERACLIQHAHNDRPGAILTAAAVQQGLQQLDVSGAGLSYHYSPRRSKKDAGKKRAGKKTTPPAQAAAAVTATASVTA